MSHPHDEDARCEECTFWVDLDTPYYGEPLGECHKRAPGDYVHRYERDIRTGGRRWPDTRGDDWCNEFNYRKKGE